MIDFILENFSGLLDWIIDQPILLSIIFLLAFFNWLFKSTYRELESRNDLIRMVRLGSWRNWYGTIMNLVLSKTDKIFLTSTEYATLPFNSASRAWSSQLYDKCLFAALVYPTLALYIHWGFGDTGINIGQYNVRPNVALSSIQTLALCSTILSLALVFVTLFSEKRKWLFATLSIALAVFGEYFIRLFDFFGISTSIAVVICVSLASMGSRKHVGIVSSSIAFSIVAAASIYLVLVLRGYEPDTQYIDVIQDQFANSGDDSLSIFLANKLVSQTLRDLTVGLLLFGGLFWILKSVKLTKAALAACTLLLISAYMLIAATGHVFIEYHLLLGIFPLMNAVFDFGSIGLTRWALRRGVKRIGWMTLAWGVFDLILGLSIFILLCVSTISLLHLLNVFSSDDGVSLQTAFADLRNQSSNSYLWLQVIFFSTLLPTIIHFSIAICAVGPSMMSLKARTRVSKWLETGDQHFIRRESGLFLLTVWSSVSIILPILILFSVGEILLGSYTTIGLHLLNFLETYFLFIV